MKESVLENKLSLHAVNDKSRWYENKAKFAAEILRILLQELEPTDAPLKDNFRRVIRFCEGYTFDDEE